MMLYFPGNNYIQQIREREKSPFSSNLEENYGSVQTVSWTHIRLFLRLYQNNKIIDDQRMTSIVCSW